MDVEHIEIDAANDQIDAFIERRARQAADDRRTEEAWKASVRHYNAQGRAEYGDAHTRIESREARIKEIDREIRQLRGEV